MVRARREPPRVGPARRLFDRQATRISWSRPRPGAVALISGLALVRVRPLPAAGPLLVANLVLPVGRQQVVPVVTALVQGRAAAVIGLVSCARVADLVPGSCRPHIPETVRATVGDLVRTGITELA
jgi:hypothetical protein